VRRAATAFWGSTILILFADAGYPALLAGLDRYRARREPPVKPVVAPTGGDTGEPLPPVSVIVAAYAEERGIGQRVQNLRELDYPADRLEVIVASDGSADDTVARARAAGADLVLDLPRGGKVRTQNAAVRRARGEILAFSDANANWEPGALRAIVAAFADPDVGYVCGDVRFVNDGGTNQEGLYWRYEMAIRRLESRLRSVTAGNGAIYATRRETYIEVDSVMGHDLSFPFNMVKRGRRAVYAPEARATERMVPSLEGEFARKRRFMAHTWPIMLRGGILSPRGYDPLYALMIFSHRVLRYLTPFLHAVALGASLALVGHGMVYEMAVAAQLAVLAAAALAPRVPLRPMLVARYYVLTTASTAAGLWDWLVHGTEAGWDPVQEIR
jgi:cellulose synthase/poly-beta-1,6-N-acetylglucosamine synthase-like glycosyltransferase